jgi:hypothetical protein
MLIVKTRARWGVDGVDLAAGRQVASRPASAKSAKYETPSAKSANCAKLALGVGRQVATHQAHVKTSGGFGSAEC